MGLLRKKYIYKKQKKNPSLTFMTEIKPQVWPFNIEFSEITDSTMLAHIFFNFDVEHYIALYSL